MSQENFEKNLSAQAEYHENKEEQFLEASQEEELDHETLLEQAAEKIENQEELNPSQEQAVRSHIEENKEAVTEGFRKLTEAIEIENKKETKPSIPKKVLKGVLWIPFGTVEVAYSVVKAALWVTSIRSAFLTVLDQMIAPKETTAKESFAWASFDNKVAGVFGQRAEIFSDPVNYPELDRQWEEHQKRFYTFSLAKRSKVFGKFKDWFWKDNSAEAEILNSENNENLEVENISEKIDGEIATEEENKENDQNSPTRMAA